MMGAMSANLRRILEVEVQNNFILYLYIGLANQHEEYGKGGGDTEQFGNVQESERYEIHVSGTKKHKTSLFITIESAIVGTVMAWDNKVGLWIRHIPLVKNNSNVV